MIPQKRALTVMEMKSVKNEVTTECATTAKSILLSWCVVLRVDVPLCLVFFFFFSLPQKNRVSWPWSHSYPPHPQH